MRFWSGVKSLAIVALSALMVGQNAGAINLQINDRKSLQNAANIAKDNMLVWYNGNEPGQIPGVVTGGYYWWTCGVMLGQLVHHWHITGNDTYNDLINQALVHQVGPDKNYMPPNQSNSLGNDDIIEWGLAAMDAAETKFPDPPADSGISWLAMAQAVFNEMVKVWDPDTCKGGLRWQHPPFLKGYDYKNVITNGGFFQLGARLARFTGNDTYADWAKKSFDWMLATKLIEQKSPSWMIWDGAHVDDNCTSVEQSATWTYAPGILISGAAYLYNYTDGDPKWKQRLDQLLGALDVYCVEPSPAMPANTYKQGGSILAELACEGPATQTCNLDNPVFKAMTSQYIGVTTLLAPYTKDRIMKILRASAVGAAGQCVGNADGQTPGTVCGRRWYQKGWDGFYGFGEQMSAMSVFQNNLIDQSAPPVTSKTGGTSKGNPNAGMGTDDSPWVTDPLLKREMTVGDRIGAAILTITSTGLISGIAIWMIVS